MYLSETWTDRLMARLAHADAESSVEGEASEGPTDDGGPLEAPGVAGVTYRPYLIGGPFKPTVRLTNIAGAGGRGLGQAMPVLVLKDNSQTTFTDKMKELLPFSLLMLGVSVFSSLIVHWMLKPRGR